MENFSEEVSEGLLLERSNTNPNQLRQLHGKMKEGFTVQRCPHDAHD